MADVVHPQSHSFPFYGDVRPNSPTQVYDELSSETEAPEWFSFPPKPSGSSSKRIAGAHAPMDSGNDSRTHARANNSLSALPAFSFNPAGLDGASEQYPKATALSAVSAPTTPARAGRHRRTASELIGGNPRLGIGSYRSGSPNHEWLEAPTSPSSAPFGSLPSRLEHRHRRTDTMSSQDVINNNQISPNEHSKPLQISSSAVPQISPRRAAGSTFLNEVSQSATLPFAAPRIRHNESTSGLSQAPRTPSRHRVGFSETLEFIPRPLSTISSESGSSMSTIRAHSISGSISSVMCSGTSSPLGKSIYSPTKLTFEDAEKLPRARSTSPNSENIYARSHVESNTEVAQRPISAGASPNCSYLGQNEQLSSNAKNAEARAQLPNVEASRSRRSGPWTALLGRKSKSDLNSLAPPITSHTGPSNTDTAIPAESRTDNVVELSEDFDADPTSIIISEPRPLAFTPPVTPPVTPNERKRFSEDTQTAAVSNMIDLDMALGSDTNQEGRVSKGRSFSEARRSMHSNVLSSGFLNSNVHRRADSAPAMILASIDPPGFRERNNSISSFKRPQMEDVFEEDEDDNPPKVTAPQISNRSSVGLGLNIHGNDTTSSVDVSVPPATPSDMVGTPTHSDFSSRKLRFDVPWDNTSTSGSESADITRDDGTCSDVSAGHRYSGTFVKAAPDGSMGRHLRSAGSDTFPLPNRFNNAPVTRTGSPLSSSNCGCGNDCSSLLKKETASSSGTEIRKPYAQSVGERGSDLRYSVDDVPSLISSGSVISNAHVRAPSSSRSFAPRSTSSSLSLSSGMERRRKRSSIVSLSRLVGVNFADKPRNPLEPGKRWQNPMEVEDPKQQKPSRLSRLLKFWKAKDTTT